MELKERISLILILLTIGACLASVAQTPVFFSNESNKIEHNFSSDIAIAVADVNNDFRDDLIRLSESELIVSAQLNSGRFFKDQFSLELPFDVTTINVGNINNENANDIFISGFKGGFMSFEITPDFNNYIINEQMPGDYYAQGSNINDINQDGFLDVIVTNDIGFNQTFINDGFGELIADKDVINFEILSEEDSEGNYNGIWFDADQDNDLDLFISKCHIKATSSSDLRRINQLYVNDEGSFSEQAATFGVSHGAQTWCADSGDLDNDGDVDLVVINHGAPSMILENNGLDSFITHEVFSSNGMIISDDLQVVVSDYNNDGLLDICIAGVKSQLLLNKGNLQFEAYSNAFGFGNMTSMASGDLNSDGWIDIIGVYGDATSGIQDRLLINQGGFFNSITLSFVGQESNINGIGAKVEVYSGGERQTRWIKSGVSYGITNSLNAHFGLGESEQIDTLVCLWPSGNVDKYYSLDVNEHFILTENSCIEPILQIDNSNDFLDCNNEEIHLSNEINLELNWNNNVVSDRLTVNEVGYYFAESKSSSCSNTSNIIYIDTLDALVRPELTLAGDLSLCEGDVFVLSTIGNEEWLWNKNGIEFDFGEKILIDVEGIYQAYSANACDTLYSDALHVIVNNVSYSSRSDTVLSGSDISLNIEGERVEWFDSDTSLIVESNNIDVLDLRNDTQFYFKVFNESSTVVYDAFPQVDSFQTSYPSDQLNGGLGFRVNEKCLLKSLAVETDLEGERVIIILDDSGDTIFRQNYNLAIGLNEMFIDVVLEKGNYKITTDREVNQQNFGHIGPRLASLENGTLNFPVSINGYVDLEFSLSGLGDFSHFFNWKIEPVFKDCFSDFIPYSIIIDTTVSTGNIDIDKFTLFPNPSHNAIEWNSKTIWDLVEIINQDGQVLYYSDDSIAGRQIIVEELSQGIYFIRFIKNKDIVVKRFCKY